MFFSVKLEGGERKREMRADSTVVNRRKQFISIVKSCDFKYSISLYLLRLSSVMDFYFGLVAIFLLIFLDVICIWSADVSSNSNVQLSSGIANNPFLRSINFPNAQNQNPFLQPANSNKNGNPFLSNNFTSQSNIQYLASNTASSNNHYNPFPNSMNNPFLNPKTESKFDSESSSSPRPSTQSPYTSPTYHSPSSEDLISIKINPGKTISEIKCDEYVGQIAGTTSIMSLTGSSSAVLKVNNVCENANRLVVGGTEARDGEFPHMVALGRRTSEFILMCSGTLISHSWVLSAAHCTYGPDGGPTHARLGFHRLTDQSQGIIVDINNTITHPHYKAPAMYADICLVQLKNDVAFSTSIRPACLYQQYDTVPRKAWVSGWGTTEFGGEVSDRLQKVQLELVDNLLCTIRHNSSTEVPYGITPSMICAGDLSGNWTKDTCQGDSGGPLQIVHSKSQCLFQVIGITSFGQGCAMIDIPAVYTRVSHYLPWIEDIVWPRG